MKHVFWAVLTILLIAYSVVVWSWWQEGNAARREAEMCHKYDDMPETQVDKIPDNCLPYYYKNQ